MNVIELTKLKKSSAGLYGAVVVGSGLFGLTLAERISHELGLRVLIVERRDFPGGNVRSVEWEDTGIPVHLYGPHIFHTSNEEVWSYVNRFTSFNSYRHHVWARNNKGTFPLPVNLATLSQLWGEDLSPQEARRRLQKELIDIKSPKNFEEKALSSVGKEIYELFFEGYTKKQWGRNPSELPASNFSRLPIRFSRGTGYFSDKYEGIPDEGYSQMVDRMLASDLIDVVLQTDWKDVKGLIPNDIPLIYSGAIDEFFDYRHGQLGWRTVDIEFRIETVPDYQGCSQMNFSDSTVPYTREVEYKHFHPESQSLMRNPVTVVSREYPREAKPGEEVYYPVNSPSDRIILEKYRKEAEALKNVWFGGRLGSYLYLDMHMAIASALSVFRNELYPELLKLSSKPGSQSP